MKRIQRLVLGCLVCCAVLAPLCEAVGAELAPLQKDIRDLRRQVGEIKETQKTIRDELQEIKTILERITGAPHRPPAEINLTLDSHPTKGDKNAKLVLVEFTDYQYPFCAQHCRETLGQIEKEYVKTGKLRYVLWDFPLESIHKDAFKAHEAAHCAGEVGKYWEMHDQLFQNQNLLGKTDLPNHAESIGIDKTGFQRCLDTAKYAPRIRKSFADAQRFGVTGTPTFFLSYQTSEKVSKILNVIRGAQPYAQFKEEIEKSLNGLNQ